jgi:hypothetical protein
MQKPKTFFSFEIPIQKSTYKNGSTLSRKIGDVVVSVDNDVEIISLMYGGVDILPLIEKIKGAMDFFYAAVENNQVNRRLDLDVEEENEEREVSNF